MIGLLLLCALSPQTFGAPVPARVEVVDRATSFDSHGREVKITILRTPTAYGTLKRFYRKKARGRKHVKVIQTRESVDPDHVLDPKDPKTWVRVLRVQSFDYGDTWAAVFVRRIDGGSLLAVVQRHPPPELAGDTVPQPLTIPRKLFETKSLGPIRRD